MKVGVPKETAVGERRVALVPELVAKLDGIEVVVEQGAGTAASFTDDAFTEAGAAIGDPWAADLRSLTAVSFGTPTFMERITTEEGTARQA